MSRDYGQAILPRKPGRDAGPPIYSGGHPPDPAMPRYLLRSLLLLAAVALAACRAAPPDADAPAWPQQAATATATANDDVLSDPLQGRVAAHYFGRQWPKNFIAGFRREHVAEDFARLRADGFDTVVLVVSWGDFQPVIDPCCGYDERAFERLQFLVERAAEQELKVMLRLGYAWFFHPDAGDVEDRQHRLMNQPEARDAFQQFLARVSRELADQPHVVLGFMSWEDLWLRRMDESIRPDYLEYLATLPADPSRTDALPDPVDQPVLFHGFWDWLVIEKFYRPALPLFPRLSFEARVDREPRFEPGPDGAPVVAEWIGHEGMTRLPAGQALTIYWAPFWGAANQGEQLPAERSLQLLDALLRETSDQGRRPLFIDQFNVVDNTPGHGTNAVLRPEEIASFLHQSVCLLKARGVVGYGLWTARDYAENSLHNPSFSHGLEAWDLQRASGPATAALQSLPSGDFQLRLAAGDRLAQRVPGRHGRLPRSGDALDDQVCVEAEVVAPGRLSVQAGAGPATTLEFDAAGRQRRCAALQPEPVDGDLPVLLVLQEGELALREVHVFDHVQYGGLYDLQGDPGPLLEAFRRMNRDFRAVPAPRRCG